MKIWLVEPPHPTWRLFRMSAPSLGLASLAAVLEKDHQVTVVDFATLRGGWAAFEEKLVRDPPDVVGVTAILTYYFPEALQVAAFVRALSPRTLVVGGGYQFTACAEDVLRGGNVDLIVRGEGEDTFLEIAAGGRREDILGLSYLAEGRVQHNPDRPLRDSLDELPLPAWHHFAMDGYSLTPLGGRRASTLTVSRGCAYRCGFCSETFMWKSRIRRQSPQRAVEGLEVLARDFGRDTVLFGDNDFLGDAAWAEGFVEALSRRRLRINFWIQTTCLSVTRQAALLSALRRLGMTHVMLGVESLSEAVLKRYRKPQNPQTIERAARLVREAGLSPFGFLMWGDAHDTEASLRQGMDFMLEHCDLFSVNATMPLPATPYRTLSGSAENDFRRFDKYQMLVHPDGMDPRAAQEMWERAAFHPRVTRRFLREALVGRTAAGRAWARHSLLVEWLFDLLPPARDGLDDYLQARGRAVPEWRLQPA